MCITGTDPGHRISDALPPNPSRCSTGTVCLRVRECVGASHVASRAHLHVSTSSCMSILWFVLTSCTAVLVHADVCDISVVYMIMYMYMYLHVCMHMYLYMYTYIHTYIHTFMHTLMHTFMHTFIHTFIIHTYASYIYVCESCRF